MIVLVTGVAGFIGSTLAERLLAEGHEVRGVDAFTDYYHPAIKAANVVGPLRQEGFTLVKCDLRSASLEEVLHDVEVVFHLAAQPGVRRSWVEFDVYLQDNVLATHRLLEATRSLPRLERFVYASSSSVYGDAAGYPTAEGEHLRPHSPYGVTKLAAEQLCTAYAANWGVPTTSLRLFTVYGPRQRPDMAFHRLCLAALDGSTFKLFGDGSARRSFTFVDDVVDAFRRAALAETAPGAVINIAGTTDVSISEVIELVQDLTETELEVEYGANKPGDVRRTGGDIGLAQSLLGWRPQVGLRDGLLRQLAWHKHESTVVT